MRLLLAMLSALLITTLPAEESKLHTYEAQNYSHLLEMPGWNQGLLTMHFKLYQGYVTNANLLIQKIESLASSGQSRSYEFGALKRRLDWEFDGMRLHELYFSNLGASGALDASLQKAIEKDFGSVDAWRQDFISTGMIRGIGWVVLYRDTRSGSLFNVWINEHDTGHLVQAEPLLVMDVFEHAYITQFGLEKEKYIELFWKSIDWSIVNKRWSSSKVNAQP